METQAGQPQDKTGPSLWSVFVVGGGGGGLSPLPRSPSLLVSVYENCTDSRRPAERRPCVSIVTVTMAPEAWIQLPAPLRP